MKCVFVAACLFVAALSGAAVFTVSQGVETDASVPLCAGDQAAGLLENPDRGLRMEAYLSVGEAPEAYPAGNLDPFARASAVIEKYSADSPTLCQVYVYLYRYVDRDLDECAFGQIRRFLELFREKRIKVLLRFAYLEENTAREASPALMVRHLDQIKAFFDANPALIADAVSCLQAGMIGMWGEGHSSRTVLTDADRALVLNKVCAIAPEWMFVQVRTHELYKTVDPRYRSRLAFHDDYLVGDLNHGWAFLPGAERFAAFRLQALRTLNDGEMPWGGVPMNDEPGKPPVNALPSEPFLRQIHAYALSSLSLEHNYREGTRNAPYSMARWKEEHKTAEAYRGLGLTVNPSLFADSAGHAAPVSVFDFIRYHLGYHLALTKLRRNEAELAFSIVNFGMAAPLALRSFQVVVERPGEKAEAFPLAGYDPAALQGGATLGISLALPGPLPENTRLGIRLAPHEGADGIRFANATPYRDGVHWLNLR